MKTKLTLPLIISSLLIMIGVITFQQGYVSANNAQGPVSSVPAHYTNQQNMTGTVSIVSLDENSELADGSSARPSISADGQFIAFQSEASLNLSDTNTITDVYRVSISPGANSLDLVSIFNTVAGNGGSTRPSISPDGQFVAFQSDATNLTNDDNNGFQDIFFHDLSDGVTSTVRASQNQTTGDLDGDSSNPSISTDGLYIVFESNALNVVANTVTDENGKSDIFRYNRIAHNTNTTNTVTFISVAGSSSINAANDESSLPSIVLDESEETHVAFYSKATNLQTNPAIDSENSVYVKSNGVATYVDDGQNPTISDDGQTVAYVTNDSCSKIRVAQKSGASWNVEAEPFTQGTNKAYESPAISADGVWLAFVEVVDNTKCTDSATPNSSSNVYLANLETQETFLISRARHNTSNPANNPSYNPAIAVDNGEVFIAFESWATNLVAGLTDTNGSSDIFLFEGEIEDLVPIEPTPTLTSTATPIPTMEMTPVPTPTATPAPTAGPIYLPLISRSFTPFGNTAFESDGKWEFNPNTLGASRTMDDAISGYSGLVGNPAYAAGQVPEGYGEIRQSFSIPLEAQEFSFDYKVHSHDRMYGPSSGNLFDTFEVYLVAGDNTDGSFITEELQKKICVSNGKENELHVENSFIVLCGGHNGAQATDANDANVYEGVGGNRPSITLPEAFKGQNVTLIVRVYNRGDGFFNTWAYVDNFEVE